MMVRAGLESFTLCEGRVKMVAEAKKDPGAGRV